MNSPIEMFVESYLHLTGIKLSPEVVNAIAKNFSYAEVEELAITWSNMEAELHHAMYGDDSQYSTHVCELEDEYFYEDDEF